MVHEKKVLFNGLFIALIVCAVYANSLGNGFVWDDDFVILASRALKRSILEVFTTIDSGRSSEVTPYYRPLTLLSFFLEYRIHGLNVFWVRFFNVMLHCVNTLLLFRLARVVMNNAYGVVIATLLFAVHPIHSEAVNFNAGGRNTMLAALFILITYLLHCQSIKSGRQRDLFLCMVFYSAGLLSKETALFLLPVIGFQELDFLRSPEQAVRRQSYVRFLPYVICTLIYLMLRSHVLEQAGAHVEILNGLGARLYNNFYIIPRYVLSLVWPSAISAKYFVPPSFTSLLIPLTATWLIIITVSGWILVTSRTKVTLFGVVWLVAFWVPVSGIFPIPSAPLADRYLYVPMIGLWLIVGDVLSPLLQKTLPARRFVIVLICFMGLFLSVITFRRNKEWKSDITLFTALTKAYPEQAFGYHNLGCAWLDKGGNLYLAEQSFNKAFAIDPAFPRLRTQLGYVRMLRQDYPGALQYYAEAILTNPLDAEAYLNSGIALEKLGRYDEALVMFQRFADTPGGELPEARITISEKIVELMKNTENKNSYLQRK